MAGRQGMFRLLQTVLALMSASLTIALLIVTGIWDPRPAINNFLDSLTRLSVPEPTWTVQLDGAADVLAVMDPGRVVVASRGFVEAYLVTDGSHVWRWKAYWAYPAGDVVVARQKPDNPDANPDGERGYSVFDPGTGAIKWGDHDAIAVWVYSTGIVDLICPDENQCQLRGRSHQTGAFTWPAPVNLPGQARTIRGPNPALAGVRDPAEWFAKAATGVPGKLPTFMAIPLDGQLYVINTVTGQYVRKVSSPDRETKVAFIGDRQLLVRAERADSGCRFSVEAFDVTTEESRWQEHGFDLDTVRGAGCDQRLDPLGAGGRLVVNGTDARPMLVEADRAVRTWTGVPGDQVLATDGLLAVILAADGKHLKVIDASAPGGRTLWSVETGLNPQAAITDSFVIIRDRDARKVSVIRRDTMAVKLELKTLSDVIGFGGSGIVITTGRTIGYHEVG